MDRSSLDIEKNEHRIFHTASEPAMKGRQIVEEQGCKLLEEDKSDNPRMSQYYNCTVLRIRTILLNCDGVRSMCPGRFDCPAII